MIWELCAYNTDGRYPDDVRYREYTSSERQAKYFAKIPRIQFTDSGHGIVFRAIPHKGRRKGNRYLLDDYVREHMAETRATEKPAKRVSRTKQLATENAKLKAERDGLRSDMVAINALAKQYERDCGADTWCSVCECDGLEFVRALRKALKEKV